ncbi:LacI family DNA-binding transcriptional regulator [Arthrobacter sp. SPG23]|uniref:LacI family DNA-binding transcriptional regulator n=1 Tax=Arthrobacter sp. SPG23 TaxID=1610703 RepID=UPI000AC82694
MSNKAVGIKDVAAAAGVSVTTVSQVLNSVAYAGLKLRAELVQSGRSNAAGGIRRPCACCSPGTGRRQCSASTT